MSMCYFMIENHHKSRQKSIVCIKYLLLVSKNLSRFEYDVRIRSESIYFLFGLKTCDASSMQKKASNNNIYRFLIFFFQLKVSNIFSIANLIIIMMCNLLEKGKSVCVREDSCFLKRIGIRICYFSVLLSASFRF